MIKARHGNKNWFHWGRKPTHGRLSTPTSKRAESSFSKKKWSNHVAPATRDSLVELDGGSSSTPQPFCFPPKIKAKSMQTMDSTFIVERLDGSKAAVPADQLVSNAGLCYLQEHPIARGKECRCATAHDVKQCKYIHFQTTSCGQLPVQQRKYTVQLRDGSNLLCESVALCPGRGVSYLDRHPTASGKECTNMEPHDPGSCSFIHFTSIMLVNLPFLCTFWEWTSSAMHTTRASTYTYPCIADADSGHEGSCRGY